MMVPRQRPDNKGFTLIEVLIATLIMVMSIVTVTAAIRQFAIHREKLRSYEQLYTTVLSLRDRIMNDTLIDNASETGSLNGLAYRSQCRLVESANNYVLDSEDPGRNGNTGAFTIMLFKVTLVVEGKNVEFYKTQFQKHSDAAKSEF